MKKVTVVLLAVALCATCVKDAPALDVQCEWRYRCCEWNASTDSCMALCQKAIIVCETTPAPAPSDRPQKNRFNVITTPCNEGYKLDRMSMCRRVF